MSDKVLVFAKRESESVELLKGGEDGLSQELPTKVIRENMRAFLVSVESIVADTTPGQGAFSLQSFDVAVGIDGKGRVGFLGTGAEVGASATLTLSFAKAG